MVPEAPVVVKPAVIKSSSVTQTHGADDDDDDPGDEPEPSSASARRRRRLSEVGAKTSFDWQEGGKAPMASSTLEPRKARFVRLSFDSARGAEIEAALGGSAAKPKYNRRKSAPANIADAPAIAGARPKPTRRRSFAGLVAGKVPEAHRRHTWSTA